MLRKDAIYAVGPQPHASTTEQFGYKLEYETGKVLAELPRRRACTRATGSIDSIFYRASGGTVRMDVASNTAQHIAPMRPPCQDGVIISNGLLYWGPWMCGCQLSLYGHVCLAPGGEFHGRKVTADSSRLEPGTGDPDQTVEKFETAAGDWPSYQGNNARTAVSRRDRSATGPPAVEVSAVIDGDAHRPGRCGRRHVRGRP